MESKDHPVSGIQIRLFPSKSQNAILISYKGFNSHIE